MTRIVILPIVAAGLIVVGVVVALWMAGSASGERDKFSSLEIAPKEADVFFAVNTDPTSPQWLAVNDRSATSMQRRRCASCWTRPWRR